VGILSLQSLIDAAVKHGSHGGRRREVSGPYRSQSSIPAIRHAATPQEHRRVNPFERVAVQPPPALAPIALPSALRPGAPSPASTIGSMLTHNSLLLDPTARPVLEDPQVAYDLARTKGVQPDARLRDIYRKQYGPGIFSQIQKAALAKLGSQENLGEPADLTNLIVGAATLGGGLYLKGALTGAEAGAGALEAGEAAGSASKASQALRALSFPLRHPVLTAGSPVAAEAPSALLHGNPAQLGKAFTGKGIEADLLAGAGHAVTRALPGVAGHALSDALSLPAQVLPSTYLTGRAAVNALQGDPAELNELRSQFQQTSAFPALLRGEVGEAASRAGEHPLYTALEAAALKAGAGLGAGAVARRLRIPGTGHELRPDLVAYGDVLRQQGPYSKDLITRYFQRRADERRPIGPHGEKLLRPAEAAKHLRGALDREIATGEVVRKGNQRKVSHELESVGPQDKAQASVVTHAIQGIARNPDLAVADLQTYRDNLVAQQPHLTPSELTTNRKQIEAIDKALANPNPAAIYNAVRTFVEQQKPITEGLVERGLLDPEQARKAIAIPYARTHMDAGYGLSREHQQAVVETREAMKQTGLSKQERGTLLGRLSSLRAKAQTLDRAGDPLSLDAIEAHMRENGVEPADLGFVTPRPAPVNGPATSFQPANERASLPAQRRTGEATTRGTFDPSWESVVQQAIHGRTILDKVLNFEHLVDRFGLRSPDGRAFADSAEAKRAAEHPEDFNMRLPDIPGGWKPIRLSPWLAKKSEIEAASGLGHNNALEADQHQMIENFSADSLKNALEPGNGPAILIPKIVADRMRQHFQESSPIEKAAQAFTGALKGVWLPTSPKWITGNAGDNYIVRAFGTGITPHDMLTGKRFANLFEKVLTPEERARAIEPIIGGGIFGSYPRTQQFRSVEQFAGTNIEPIARAAHAVLTAPGVRTFAELYRRYRDTVFELDSKYIEQTPQYGQLAKSARRELDMTRRQFRQAVKAQSPVVMDLIRGFRNPEQVDRFAKEVERVFGNWSKLGPDARRYLSTYSPFWMWGRAALKFAAITLPKDHPILTGIIAATEQMTREERQKLGLDFAGTEPLPGFLQGGVPDSHGGITGLAGLTTFGTFADPTEFLAQSATPQLNTLLSALQGLDWKGDQLVDAAGRPASTLERVKAGIFGTAESMVPFLNVARSVLSRGPSGALPARDYPKSTVDYLRGLHNTQQVNVPISGSSGGSSDSSNPFENADLGGSSTNPFESFQP